MTEKTQSKLKPKGIEMYMYLNNATICCCVLCAALPWWRKGSATHFYSE
jgi:hypothetical protein